MIGIWQSYSDIYLYVIGAAMLVTFGIPLVFVPLAWAKVFRWEVPQEKNLVVFLGRSAGILISLLAIFAFQAAASPVAKPFYFDLMIWILAANIALHAYGAIRKTQPITETVEIVLWVAMFLVTLGFYPA
jgi:hypothetical protein